MALRIEDYALVGDTKTAALVGRDGSVDWMCCLRFDADACFAALLGTPQHGRWLLAPASPQARSHRCYRDSTLILETEFTTPEGTVAVIDFMPLADRRSDLVRCVEGRSGRVAMTMELAPRFGYGERMPWFKAVQGGTAATAGPDSLLLRSEVPVRMEDRTLQARFEVEAGQRVAFVLTSYRSHREPPPALDAERSLSETEAFWREWSARCCYRGPWLEPVVRSLITLKALTYSPTGGVLAAPTTSLPERPGGIRNWDYRYCWIRDATLTLTALLDTGYREEARAWRDWLLRTVAGDPDDLQIMYGVAGERRLTELELDWLPGYEGSRPVRLGNAASLQRQLDVYGEVMDCLHQALRSGLELEQDAWNLQVRMMNWLESHWAEPDDGIWEVRGPRQQFTHSKVMAWVAVDRSVKSMERFGLAGKLEPWRDLRARIHREVCEKGFDPARNAFTQVFGNKELDASLLMMPLVGFLPATDPRVLSTVEAIQRELTEDGLVHRYDTRHNADGLPPGEGVFLACSFWLADCLALLGRRDQAEALFSRLLGLRNDVGLLSEQYLPQEKRLVGNFPQAFSHLSLVETAQALRRAHGVARRHV